jgi:hypothetical protein
MIKMAMMAVEVKQSNQIVLVQFVVILIFYIYLIKSFIAEQNAIRKH